MRLPKPKSCTPSGLHAAQVELESNTIAPSASGAFASGISRYLTDTGRSRSRGPKFRASILFASVTAPHPELKPKAIKIGPIWL
jgi:hypothetical protein